MCFLPKNLLYFNEKEIQQWLNTYETILTDCDGVLWHFYQPLPQTVETVNRLSALGKRVYFVTNNSTKTRNEIWQKSQELNFQVPETQIITPTFTVASYLQKHLNKGSKVFVIGSEAIVKELSRVGLQSIGVGPETPQQTLLPYTDLMFKQIKEDNVQAVVVGVDEYYSFNKILKACNILLHNEQCLFVATNGNKMYNTPDFILPDTGSLIVPIECCTQRSATTLGKPNKIICDELIAEGFLKPETSLMIGDCIYNDIAFGKNCGFSTLLVGTGRHNWYDVENLAAKQEYQYLPDYYIPSLGDLCKYLY